MTDRRKACCLLTAVSAVLFAALILCVTLVDVRPIGPLDSRVGLATLNAAARDRIGTSAIWYTLSSLCGYLSLASAVGFACLGLYQWITRKRLRRVDRDLYLLAAFYALVLMAYLFFEVVVINHRPVLSDGTLEASFPSSHTVLALCFLGAAIPRLATRLRKRPWRTLSVTACALVMALAVISRTLSGVHWLTDILGGLLLSGVLLGAYGVVSSLIPRD